VKENQYRAKDRKLKLTFKPTKKVIPQVEADRTRIHEVIENLMSNAIKYTPKGKIEVWCDANKADKTILVYVKDTGIGISPKDKKMLFTKFGRIRNHVSKKERMAQIVRPGGTGLGLYLVKGILRLHGGEIKVKSTLDEGSTFWFSLPIKHKIAKKNIINPIFSEKGEKNVFRRLGLGKEKE
jgi:signal transduction histidine kinase